MCFVTNVLISGFFMVTFIPFLESGQDGGFLLDPLPTEDPEPSTTPVFLEEPQDSYVIRNKPATLSCKARHALQVYFECNGNMAENRQHSVQQYVNPMTGVRQVEVSVDVTRGDVEKEKSYSCYCFAWSSTGRIRSRKAVVTLASVDGRWTSWSAWSSCGVDCRHYRRRSCTNPTPSNGGRYCPGKDITTSNCTGGICRTAKEKEPALSYGTEAEEATPAAAQPDVTLYVGVFVAIVFFVLVVIAAVFLVRRIKGRDPCMYRGRGTEVIRVQPDLTQLSGEKLLVPPSPAQSRAPLLMDAPQHRSLTPSSTGKPPHSGSCPSVVSSSASTMSHPSTISDQETPSGRHSVTSAALPPNLDIECIAWGTVTKSGGRISVPGSGITLTIPPGAIKKGANIEVYVAVLREDKDRPRLTETETMLSPVILCGPSAAVLKKSAIVTFQHCALLANWRLSVHASDSPTDDDNPNWKRVVTLGEETLNTPLYCQVDGRQCHVVADHLCRYALVGESAGGAPATKALALAAFAPYPAPPHYSIRVYCVEDTKAALQGVLQVEQRLGGRLLDRTKSMPFVDGGANLCLCLEDVAPGWRCKPGANYQEIPFQHVWNGRQNNLHCSFTLENVDRSQKVRCHILVYQRGVQAHRQLIKVNPYDNSCREKNLIPSPTLNWNCPVVNSTVSTNDNGCPLVMLDPPIAGFRLTQQARKQLRTFLDPPNLNGNDWRRLAQELEVDRYINYFATKPSPTEYILDLWEARHRDSSAITDLLNILRMMGREDAAMVLEKEAGSWL